MSKSDAGNDAADSSGPTEETDRSGVYRASYDPDGPATVSDAVIEAIADVAGVDPTSTVIPLSESVDPDALDALFAEHEGETQVAFQICGLRVLVRSDGRVRIVDDAVSDDG